MKVILLADSAIKEGVLYFYGRIQNLTKTRKSKKPILLTDRFIFFEILRP